MLYYTVLDLGFWGPGVWESTACGSGRMTGAVSRMASAGYPWVRQGSARLRADKRHGIQGKWAMERPSSRKPKFRTKKQATLFQSSPSSAESSPELQVTSFPGCAKSRYGHHRNVIAITEETDVRLKSSRVWEGPPRGPSKHVKPWPAGLFLEALGHYPVRFWSLDGWDYRSKATIIERVSHWGWFEQVG